MRVTVGVGEGRRVRVAVGPMGDGVSDGAGKRVAEGASVDATVCGRVSATVWGGEGVGVTAGFPSQADERNRGSSKQRENINRRSIIQSRRNTGCE